MNRLSLRMQLVLGIVALSVLATLITSGVQLRVEYLHQLRTIEKELTRIEQSTVPALGSALWALDRPQSQLLAEGLHALPQVHVVKLFSDDQLFVQAGEISPEQSYRTRHYPLTYTNQDQEHELGELVVYASMQPVYQGLKQQAGLILGANAVRIVIVAFLIGLLFDRLVTRHVRTLVRYLQQSVPITECPPLKLERNLAPDDELQELADAVNRLRDKLVVFDRNLRQERARYAALMENNPEAIWRCDLSQDISTEVAPRQQVKAMVENAYLAEVNAAAKTLIQSPNTLLQIGDSWRQLPFLDESLFHELAHNECRVNDALTQFKDAEEGNRYFRNTLTCLIQNRRITTIWGIATEITQQVRAQQALERREQQLSLSQTRLAEAQALAHMGHWAYQANSDSLQVSDEFARIYGYAPGERPTWINLMARIHPEDQAYIASVLSDPTSTASGAEHRIIWPTGEERSVQAIVRKNIHQGKVVSTFGIIMDITERRRAEQARLRSQQALIESEARMAEAQAIAHLGHWVMDYTSKTLSCSDEFYRLHGYPPQAFPPSISRFVEHIHAEDQPRIRSALDQAKSRSFTEEYRIVRTDGQIRYMRGTVTPFYSGGREVQRVFGISMDVTESTLVQRKLQLSQELFSKAFQSSPDGIFFISCESFQFIRVNRAFEEIAGLDEQTMLRQTPGDLGLWSAQQSKDMHRLMLADPQVTNFETQMCCYEQNTLTVLLSWRPVELNNERCLLAIARDITALRALQKKAETQQKQLLQADKLASLGTMVAGVAHEINNPNHLIQMNAEMLSGFCSQILPLLDEAAADANTGDINGFSLKELQETIPELLEDIQSAGKRITRIVSDLKDFARPRDNSEYLPTDFNKVAHNTINLLSARIHKHPAKIHLKLQEELPKVQGDSQRLEQVLVNLLMNALDVSEQPGKVIEVKTYLSSDGSQLLCDITDQGPGISKDQITRIFDPFYTTKHERGGTGLGLAIAFRLIREHGGQLHALSELGQGTTMRISLPTTPAKNVAPSPEVS